MARLHEVDFAWLRDRWHPDGAFADVHVADDTAVGLSAQLAAHRR